MKKILVAPSILSADFRTLEREVRAAEDAGADMIHCDVMDGHFVPNLTFGPFIVETVKKCVSIPLDVHLMIANPEKYISAYCDAGADVLTFHAEAVWGRDLPDNAGCGTRNEELTSTPTQCRGELCSPVLAPAVPVSGAGAVDTMIKAIKRRGVRAGVAVNPDKPIELFMGDLPSIDMAVIMSVYAGFGGQKFIPDVLEKVRAVRQAAVKLGLGGLDIQVDGGVNGETAALCAGAGANVLVAGSYVFFSDDYAGRIRAVRESAL